MTPTELEHMRRDCEARAAKGEKPKMQWKRGKEYAPGKSNYWYAPAVSVTESYSFMVRGDIDIPLVNGCEPRFQTLLAAQLFAESLLREATRALWAAEVEALKAQASAGEVVHMSQGHLQYQLAAARDAALEEAAFIVESNARYCCNDVTRGILESNAAAILALKSAKEAKP